MYFEYKEKKYPIEVIRKNNKNTYIKYQDKTIIVTTNKNVSIKKIMNLIESNYKLITSWIDKDSSDNGFYLWGNSYQVIYDEKYKDIKIEDKYIYIKNKQEIEKYLKKECVQVFSKHLDEKIKMFEEPLPKFTLKIRSMKTRWGVCNKKSMTITLNSNLVKYDKVCLDYVIIHELSHFIHFNHSKEFWTLVSRYVPNYKEIKKILSERK